MDALGLRDKVFMQKLGAVCIPVMLQQLITTSMYMVDTLMIGALGDAPLAGVGAANQLAYLLDVIQFGIMSGGGIFIAQYWGKKDVAGVRASLGLCTMLSLGAAAVCLSLALLWPEEITRLFADDAAAAGYGAEYVRIAGFGYLCKAVIYPYGMTHKSCGNAKLPMLSGISGLLVNVALNYCLIFGHFGFAAMGVKGAAIATLVGSGVDAGILLWRSYARENVARARLKEMAAQTAEGLKRYIQVSVPVFCNESLWAVGTLVRQYLYGRMGADVFAAVTIVGTLDKISLVVFSGVGAAAAVVLGNTIGEGDFARAQVYGRRFIFLSFISGALFGVLTYFVLSGIPYLYANITPDVQRMAQRSIRMIACFTPFFALNYTIITGILRSGGDTRAAALIDLAPLWLICLPATAISGLYFGLPLYLVYCYGSLSNVVRCVWALMRAKTAAWISDIC